MTLKLDRAYQRELLTELASSYPRAHDIRPMLKDVDDETEEKYIANAAYLEAHGLIDARISYSLNGGAMLGLPTITARGMDFLADDGGLSAIFGVVTVKLHADTIKDLIESRVDASAASPAEKSALKKHLSTLSSEAMKTLAKSLVEKGLQNVPDVVQWLHTLLPHA
ncbi:hypothetical protein OYT13_16810 [Pandoraea sp. XJJ-1]|uniref:hypothetical protein n=1 Tax=Pandoraea sp. XJJ-1 TaxID=3002643 RepID=UPI00227E7B62|nr:hypothetical protein [Pandoraea sp. XJJ-1]WAL81500.1 hypothetical protein OYT13_16810 [Pandoraea sp. XJJ-1]